MQKEVSILVAEGNNEHFELIRKRLLRTRISNRILNFTDGQEILDFLFNIHNEPEEEHKPQGYILFLELNLAKISGLQVLEKIKKDTRLKNIPVIVLTTTNDQDTIERCHDLGCSSYIIKPAERRDFEETIQKLGRFLSFVETTLI